MSEIEAEEKTGKEWAKILLPRILRAALWSFIMGGEALIWLNLPGIGDVLAQALPAESTGVSYFLVIFIAFEVAIQLLAGTIFPYALSMARALISMYMLVQVTNGGIITLALNRSPEMPIPLGTTMVLTINFQTILTAFLLLSLVSLIKNLLQAIQFLADKAEEPVIPPELP